MFASGGRERSVLNGRQRMIDVVVGFRGMWENRRIGLRGVLWRRLAICLGRSVLSRVIFRRRDPFKIWIKKWDRLHFFF